MGWRLSHHVAALMMASVPADDVHSSIGIGMATDVMPAAMMATEAPHYVLAAVSCLDRARYAKRQTNDGDRDNFSKLLHVPYPSFRLLRTYRF